MVGGLVQGITKLFTDSSTLDMSEKNDVIFAYIKVLCKFKTKIYAILKISRKIWNTQEILSFFQNTYKNKFGQSVGGKS